MLMNRLDNTILLKLNIETLSEARRNASLYNAIYYLILRTRR